MNILVTGGAGFIGSNFLCRMIKKYPDYNFINVDKLTYAGNPDNLKEIQDNKQYTFIKADIGDKKIIPQIMGDHKITHLINFAAETHVDRSIESSDVFLQTNVMGTKNLMDSSLQHKNFQLFYQISTDEVYGSLDLDSNEQFTEETPLAPKNPYSASKAASDMLVMAYFNTFKLPAVISRCSNNYGPNQYPEKLIPFFVKKLLAGEKVPVYGDGLFVRDWIHVNDHSDAADIILHQGKPGEIYNIGGDGEISNIDLTKKILKIIGKGDEMIEYVEDRKGHDRRYSMGYGKMNKQFGWKPKVNFEMGLKETIKHYQMLLT
ncbi:dTDP-glucose 4,6-dehydratase [Patescibacteria group bacterium]|nr:dTDP-glucose 4,6-dehydratase [Patescibacteria group bacterium]